MNWIIEFLQTRTGQNATAVGVIILLGLAFILAPSRKKKPRVYVPSATRTISDRHTWLIIKIQTCGSLAELHSIHDEVKGFARETFSELPTLQERHNYTARLFKAYYNKEISLTAKAAKAELCTN